MARTGAVNTVSLHFHTSFGWFFHQKEMIVLSKRAELPIGSRFGKLIVLGRAEDKILKNGRHRSQFHCLCDCGKETVADIWQLKSGHMKSCGCLRRGGLHGQIDLQGQTFGKLTVLRRGIDHFTSRGKRKYTWICRCACGRQITVCTSDLASGNTRSCGRCKYENKYEFCGDSVIGYTNKGEPFLIDAEDYDRIKGFYWRKSQNKGYIETFADHKRTLLHRLIMNAKEGEVIDHINHQTADNRKANLRVVTMMQNAINRKTRSTNTSGCTGVCYHKGGGRKHWRAQITVDKKVIHLGAYETYEEAVIVRKAAEDRYFGEYSYDNSMAAGLLQESPTIDVQVIVDVLPSIDEKRETMPVPSR